MRRLFAILGSTLLLTGTLAVTGSPAIGASAAPTISGPRVTFATGNQHVLTGTAVGGEQVIVSVNYIDAATTTAAAGGAWTVTLDLTGRADGRYTITARDSQLGSQELTLWVQNNVGDVAITSPAAGSTVTSSTDGCLNVSASASGPARAWAYPSRAWIMVDGVAATGYVGGTPGAVQGCVPVRSVPNGAATIWVELTDGTTTWIGRIEATIDLTTRITPVVGVGTSGITISGTLTDPLDDGTVLSAQLDDQAPVEVGVLIDGPSGSTNPWRAYHYFQVWEVPANGDSQHPVRLVSDGSHTVTVTLASRGRTTTVGTYPVVVAGSGTIVITGADTSVPGSLTISGTMDNIEPSQQPSLRVDVTAGGQQFSSTSPTVTMSNPTRYGQDRWQFTVVHNVTDGSPLLVKVSALDRALDVVCAAATVTGPTLAAASCGPTAPGIPTNLRATSSAGSTPVLAFTPPLRNGGSAITGYTATMRAWGQSFPVWTRTSTGYAPSITATGIPANQNVSASIVAANSVGSSAPSIDYTLYSATLTCSKPPATAAVGSAVKLSCSYDNGLRNYRANDTPVALSVQALKPRSSTWTTLATATVVPAGDHEFAVPTSITGTWSWRVVSAAVNAPAGFPVGVVRSAATATSTTAVTGPAPKLTIKGSKSKVAKGKTVRFTATSTPFYAGQPVSLQRLVGRTWKVVQTRTLSTSSVVFTQKSTTRTDYRWRVSTPAAYGRPAGVSASVLLTVK